MSGPLCRRVLDAMAVRLCVTCGLFLFLVSGCVCIKSNVNNMRKWKSSFRHVNHMFDNLHLA